MFAGLEAPARPAGALEALLLFLMVVAAGVWAASLGRAGAEARYRGIELFAISLSAFVIPVAGRGTGLPGLGEEGSAAGGGCLAARLHRLAPAAGLAATCPSAGRNSSIPRFLSLVAWLGLACTLSRIRSGSIWPAVIIHWGVVVVWMALYAG